MKTSTGAMNGTVLVTGGARRIGRMIACDLANHGWRVIVHYNRSEMDARNLVKRIKETGGEALAVAADLLKEDEVNEIMEIAAREVGPVTCLINNASVFEEDTPMTQCRKTWDRHMEVNLRAPFILSQKLVNQIPEGEKGNIINMIDQRVWNLTPEFTSYTISKVGLWGVTQILARALAPLIRVNALGPGPTLQSAHQLQSDFKKEWASLPLREPVSTSDICKAIRFILDAPAMTGQMIALDGGQHMGWASNGYNES